MKHGVIKERRIKLPNKVFVAIRRVDAALATKQR